MFVTLFGALICAIFGLEELSLSQRSSREPEEISLIQLIRRGPDGNPNIVLTDFSIFDDYIYRKNLVGGTWTKVWVPILPSVGSTAGDKEPAAIRAFLYSEDIQNEAQVRQRFDRPKLRGMVNPNATKPGIIGRMLIRKNFPGTAPEKCLIIEEGKEPAGILKLALWALGFVVFVCLTPAIWYRCRQLEKARSEVKLIEKIPSKVSRDRDGVSEAIILDVVPDDNRRC